MATSGTKTWTLYVDEVIDESLSRIGSDPITGKEASSARRTLNIMMRDWGNRGVQLWTINETTQTVTEGTANYTLDTYQLSFHLMHNIRNLHIQSHILLSVQLNNLM